MSYLKKMNVIIALELVIMIILLIALICPSLYTHFYYDNIANIINPYFHCISEEYHIYVEDLLVPEYEEYLVSYIKESIDNGYLYQNDYYIILTDNDIKASKNNTITEYAAGITNGANKIIYINYDHIEWAFLHEIGHAIDFTYKFSKKKEFKALYNEALTHKAEAIEDIDIYILLNAKEFFAENYKRYIEKSLENTAIKEYFDEIIQEKSSR